MNARRWRRGFALPLVLVVTSLATVALAALGGYAAFSSRMTRYYLAETRCRLAAQSALEMTKADLQAAFLQYVGEVSPGVKITPVRLGDDVLEWFDAGDARSIGTRVVYEAAESVRLGGCEVRVWFGNHRNARVEIRARATCRVFGGPVASSTLQETVEFSFVPEQSPVFDNAYFVNNFGWMTGSSLVVNGRMRANGNISLSASTVNGFIYAARNEEVGADGRVSLSSSPQIKSAAAYRSGYGNRTCPDVGDYPISDAYDAPKASGTLAKPTRYEYDESGWLVKNRIGGTRAADSEEAIINEYAAAVPMPFVSDLKDYVDYAQMLKAGANGVSARLTYPGYSYTDAAGTVHRQAGGVVEVRHSGAGPSGDASLADRGALVLVGTQTDPIVIDGPVVVDSDVVIKGYVKGQGTIYSGRNIHIIGDIKYVNPPSWGHPDADDAAVAERNAGKDMLGLVAKGNIVFGDARTENQKWHEKVDEYINGASSASVVKRYACDPSDADIGYPAVFQGDYTAVETVNGKTFGKVRSRTVTNADGSKQVEFYTADDRRYYETVCDDSLIRSLRDSPQKDMVEITQIDAVLYNNHGIFGEIGRPSANFNLNGALVCRDEALHFTGNSCRFNWDFRLGRASGEKFRARLGLPVGMPEDVMRTVEWKELADE